MSISNTVKKIMPYIKTTSGYVLHRLSSQAVEMDDGTTLEEKVIALNNLISQKVDTSTVVNNLLTTEAGFVLDARQGKALNDSISDLSSKIKVETFELIPSSNVNTLAQKCYYEPLTGRVHIEAAHYTEGGIKPSMDLAIVPAKYAPKVTTTFPLSMSDTGGLGYIYTDGKIRQNASSVQAFAYYSTDYFI